MKKIRSHGAGILIFVFAITAWPGLPSAQEFLKYCNSRYGFCVSYPSNCGMEPPPVNGDGRVFYDSEGFSMVVSGRNNALDETIEGLMKSESGEFEKITYCNKSANWFVLSGFKGEKIVYIKGYVGNAAINQLTIEYPSQSKKDYDKTVTEVSRSFKPGDLLSGH